MKALVLAAGKSTRITSIADGRPKPLIQVGDSTILEHVLKWISSNSITDVWINLHYKPGLIREVVGDGNNCGCRVRYSMEEELLGTAGAVKKLEGEWDGDFIVVYGDNIAGFDIRAMVRHHKRSGAVATIAVFNWNTDAHSGIAGGRVVMDECGNVTGFVEGGEECTSPWVNAGVYVFSPKVCIYINEGFSDFGRDVFPKLLESGQVLTGFPINSYCLAADTPEALEKMKEFLKAES